MPKFISLACLIAVLFCSASHAGKHDDDDATGEAAKTATGLDSATPGTGSAWWQTAGIETQRLQAFTQQAEFNAHGTVVGLEPLLMLRQQYLVAQARQDGARARYQAGNLNLIRTQSLHEHDIVSTRRLEEQQAQWQSDQADLANSSARQQALVATGRLQWGDILTEWFILDQSKQAEAFLLRRAQLLEIILPANLSLKPGIDKIAVDRQGLRGQAITANLIAQAPTVDPVSQATRYFFAVQGPGWPAGTHVTAWIAGDAAKNVGVLLPENAVIRHLGQALVFVKTAQGEFERRTLSALQAVNQGYFVAGDLKPGDEVVTTGAQTLLSQELKTLLPQQDDD